MKKTIKNSIFASLLIGLGVYVLLSTKEPVGAFLFSFGLLTICILKLKLFTGMCGYVIENKNYFELSIVCVVNLLSGYIFGYLFSFTNVDLIKIANDKVVIWGFTPSYFIKSILCGAIMFVAVDLYKNGTKLGILLGIPLFILCGFQHCVANTIIMGIGRTFSATIFICIIGNFIGSISAWWLKNDKN